MRTIGFAGTAKNTGKTTTAQAVMKQAYASGIHLALTSIGFDGEDRDNITGLPKPRYIVKPGDLVATAEECLSAGSAELETVASTPISTILGAVVIARVTKSGTVVVAGPNRELDLRWVIDRVAELGCDLLLVDGALNRLVPMIACDGLVLATGAAFDQNIKSLTEHTAALISLFDQQAVTHPKPGGKSIRLVFTDGSHHEMIMGSLLSQTTLDALLAKVDKPLKEIIIPGACHPVLIKDFLERNPFPEQQPDFYLGGPLKLIASGGISLWQNLITEADLKFHYLQSLPVCFLSLNPFYPKIDSQSGSYSQAHVEKRLLLRSVRTMLPNFPAYDLFQLPQPDLLKLIGVTPKV